MNFDVRFHTFFFLAHLLSDIYIIIYRHHQRRRHVYWLGCPSPICRLGRWAERAGTRCAVESLQ